MKNRSEQNTGNKQEVKTNPKKYTKIQIRNMVVLVVIGIFIGCALMAIFNLRGNNKTARVNNRDNQNTAIPKPVLQDYKFINPYILTSVYDKIYHQELAIFKNLIVGYCTNAKKEKSITQIAFYFRDFTSGQWFGLNEKEKFMPASLTKVPILIAVYQLAEKDSSYLKKKLTFNGSVASRYLAEHPEIDDIRTTMKEGESYTVEQLIDLMITKSDNEASVLLYTDFGKDHWDRFQQRLGPNTPISAQSSENNFTVKSYSSFFRMLYNASLLNREYSEKALEILSRSEYNHGIRLAVPSYIKVCHKYGEIDTLVSPTQIQIQQLHHAGIVYYPGKTYFLCVMTKGSDKSKMEKIIYDLAKIAYEQVDNQVRKFQKPPLLDDIN